MSVTEVDCIGNSTIERILHKTILNVKKNGILMDLYPSLEETLEEFVSFAAFREENTSSSSFTRHKESGTSLTQVNIESSTDNILVIAGPSGIGKTSVIAKWYYKWRQKCREMNNEIDEISSPKPINEISDKSSQLRSRMQSISRQKETFFFWHVAGASSPRCIQVSHVLRRLICGLKNHFQIRDAGCSESKSQRLEDEDSYYDDKELPWLLPRMLDAVSRRGGKVVIIIDGLHRIRQHPSLDSAHCSTSTMKKEETAAGLNWLPVSFPEGIKVILTTTTPSVFDDDYFSNFGAVESLSALEEVIEVRETRKKKIMQELKRRNWKIVEIAPETM